ncbi:MAG: threonine-phosphate decarboxylase CobD [Nitrospiraceae bacterium]
MKNCHGGNVHAVARELRTSVGAILDFSASINPLGPAPGVRRAIARGFPLLAHYPDPACWTLREVLAARWKLSPEHVVVGNGSTELIHLLPRALAIQRALIIGPTFSEYARAVVRSGGQTTTLSAKRSEDYRPPLEKAVALIRSGRKGRRPIDAIFFCHPNSPTGQACGVTEALTLVREADRVGIWTILDESFVEYCEERSLLYALTLYSHLIILRSFTKFYALPGLRLGYLAASERVTCLVRELQPPWSVNALAQEAAKAAFRDQRHSRQSLLAMERERARFTIQLGSVPGLTLFPSQANFLLLELPRSHQANQVTATLRRKGVLIRDCSSTPGLNRHTIRIAVRKRRDNERLVAVLRDLLN